MTIRRLKEKERVRESLTQNELVQRNTTELSAEEPQRPIVFIHQFKGNRSHFTERPLGFFSIFDKPHIIDPSTLRPILIQEADPETPQAKKLYERLQQAGLPKVGKRQCKKLRKSRTLQEAPKQRLSYQERLRTEEEEDQGLNKLWVTIRTMKVGNTENCFVLRGGERIKIGRVVFTVKELSNEKYSYGTDQASELSSSGLAINHEVYSLTDDGQDFAFDQDSVSAYDSRITRGYHIGVTAIK